MIIRLAGLTYMRNKMSTLKVKILIPNRWFKKPSYELLEPLEIIGQTVPAGFVTDGASSPRIL